MYDRDVDLACTCNMHVHVTGMYMYLESFCDVSASMYKLIVNISQDLGLFQDEFRHPHTVGDVALTGQHEEVTFGAYDMLTSCQTLLKTAARSWKYFCK